MPQDTLTITDNRTAKSYTLPIESGTIRAMDIRQIKTTADDFGLMTYDPAFMNTAYRTTHPIQRQPAAGRGGPFRCGGEPRRYARRVR